MNVYIHKYIEINKIYTHIHKYTIYINIYIHTHIHTVNVFLPVKMDVGSYLSKFSTLCYYHNTISSHTQTNSVNFSSNIRGTEMTSRVPPLGSAVKPKANSVATLNKPRR